MQRDMQTSPYQVSGNKRRHLDVLALTWLVAFGLFFCAPILKGQVPVASDTFALWAPWSQLPHKPASNLALADSALQALPWASFERQAIADGEWPLWDPYSLSGISYAGNALSQLYYPLTWLLLPLPISGAFQVSAVVNLVLAGWGMYFLCRTLGTSRTGAVLAGMAFLGSGMSQTAIDATSVSSVYGWLPVILAATDRALRERSLGWTSAAVVACGFQAVAGNPQWSVYTYFATACWVVWRALQLSLGRRGTGQFPVRGFLGALVRGSLVLLGGVALAAAHLVPFFEMLGLSNRAGVRVSSHSDPLTYLLRLLAPGFFGNPLDIKGYPIAQSDLWYVGISTLLLVVFATGAWMADVFQHRWRARYLALAPDSSIPFWSGLAALAVLVAYGVGPFLNVRWLPGLNATVPSRIGYLFIASVAVLAALGWDRLLSVVASMRARYERRIPAFGLALGAVILAVPLGIAAVLFAAGTTWKSQPNAEVLRRLQAGELLRAVGLLLASSLMLLGIVVISIQDRQGKISLVRSRLALALPLLLIAVLALDLLSMMPGYTTFTPPDSLMPRAPSVDWLRTRPGPWRLLAVDSPVPSFVPDTQLLFGFSTVAGYYSLHPVNYDQFWGVADPALKPEKQTGPYSSVFVRPQVYTSTLADLLNVKYIVAVGDVPVSADYTPVYTGEVRIYENGRALPRAFLMPQSATRFVTSAQALAGLASPDFDPRREVLIDKGGLGGSEQARSGPEPVSVAETGSIRIVSYRRNSMQLSADVLTPAWLVVADSNYPGWRVTVDGREDSIYTADHILRAVRLSPGHHSVVFSFLPTGFVWAVFISLGTLTLVLVGMVKGMFRP